MDMPDHDLLKQLPNRLLPWYDQGHRNLPWRGDPDPYHIWLSEIMLQQTRVEAVKGYYARFLAACPTVEALASAHDDQLQKLWEGLGYYTRVRNLKKAAQVIMECHGGQFPRDHRQVLALPGIGPYTAGAICSIAFNQPTPAVDGNVLRVLSRLMTWQQATDLPQTRKEAETLLAEIYPQDRPGDFTQALMELGATVCGPNGQPRCRECPMGDLCRARETGGQLLYPVRLPKKERRQEERTVFLLSCQGRYALERRQDQGLLAGLWQFPHVPGHLQEQEALEQVERWGLGPRDLRVRWQREHIFTHIHWHLRAYWVECVRTGEPYVWRTLAEIREEIPLPTAFRQFLPLLEEERDRSSGRCLIG